MSVEDLWRRYAATWSASGELAACATDDVQYTDPNCRLEGGAALLDYMGAFRESVPGGRFRIREVASHHNRSMAHWSLLAPDDRVLQTGTSFAETGEDGRFTRITGFFNEDGSA
jgi:hypothetical protein